MMHFIEALAAQPGVEFVALISHDGVPIATTSRENDGAREQALAALATSWLSEVSRAMAPLSWDIPTRAALRAARGTLVMARSESVSLVVLLGRDTSPELVRLAMDGTLARLERARQSRGAASRQFSDQTAPPGPIPSRTHPAPVEEGAQYPAQETGRSPGT